MLDFIRSDLTPKQIWTLAIRPKTLPAAAATAIVGSGAAIWSGKFQPWPALACLLGALLLQIGANLANDVFDFFHGTDTTARLGPVRVTQSGLLTPAQVLTGMWVVFGLAAVLGAYLFSVAGWPVLLIGLACIAAAVTYSGGPAPYGYVGLGDLLVFIFFGPVAVIGTYYVQALTVDPIAVWSCLPMGFLITAILVVNNLRDIQTDSATGKKTMAVRLGERGARLEYSFCLAAAYLTPALAALLGAVPVWGALAWLSLPLAIREHRLVWTTAGRPLNRSLAGTGRLTLVYGLLYSLGLAIAFLIGRTG
jgi:1,4-dihydroxy-2-naphthoate polyprenyltransferase